MKFDVEGMTCGHCVRAVTRAVQALDPAARVEVDLDAGTVAVEADLPAERRRGDHGGGLCGDRGLNRSRRYTPPMRPFRRLLHLLLALAVAVNAVGPALASAHACCAQAQRAAPPVVRGCHEAAAATAGAPAHHAGHGATQAPEAASPSASAVDDGCGHGPAGGPCGCGCTLQATTLLPTPPSLRLAPPRATTIAFAAPTRAAPPLPHPLRPPIHAG